MASVTTKKICSKCHKSGEVATCEGCQQSFCTKHFIEHRQEISQQMDNIGQEHDVLRRDLSIESITHPLLERINQWEQESIIKIQVTAQTTRAHVRQLLDLTKNTLKTSVSKLTEEIQLGRELDDYTEIDIHKWTKRLKEIRNTLENPTTAKLEYDNDPQSTIRVIKLNGYQSLQSTVQRLKLSENNYRSSSERVQSFHERFDEILGNVTLLEGGLTALCSADSRGSS